MSESSNVRQLMSTASHPIPMTVTELLANTGKPRQSNRAAVKYHTLQIYERDLPLLIATDHEEAVEGSIRSDEEAFARRVRENAAKVGDTQVSEMKVFTIIKYVRDIMDKDLKIGRKQRKRGTYESLPVIE
jgi:precorrin-2 methylase